MPKAYATQCLSRNMLKTGEQINLRYISIAYLEKIISRAKQCHTKLQIQGENTEQCTTFPSESRGPISV